MHYANYLKELARGCYGARELSCEDASQLFGAMLDGGVPELELGGLLIALRFKGESADELAGFYDAVARRLCRLTPPDSDLRPVILPTYNGARRQANLLPLLALLLKRFGVPVLIHGPLDSSGGRVATAYVLRELGIVPSVTPAQIERALGRGGLAFVPTPVLSPGLASLLSLRHRLGVRNSAHSLVKLLDPFKGEGGYRVVNVTHPAYLDKMRDFLSSIGAHALLLRGTEGEAYANPKRRPQLEHFAGGEGEVLFEAEAGSLRALPSLPDSCDAHVTTAWTQAVLAGVAPLPLPLVNQLACCLYGAGYTQDIHQAKAIVAVETASLLHAA